MSLSCCSTPGWRRSRNRSTSCSPASRRSGGARPPRPADRVVAHPLDLDGGGGPSGAGCITTGEKGVTLMKVGFVGFGRMGGNMVTRLLERGHEAAVYARRAEVRQEAAAKGAVAAASLAELVERLAPPRVVWMMVPAGDAVEQTIAEVAPRLAKGDVLVDGGNSYYKDSCAAPPPRSRGAFSTSTRGRAAASGGFRWATA